MADHVRLAGVLGEFAATLLGDHAVEDLLDRLCHRVVEVLPVAAAGVMRRDGGGRLRFVTGTDERMVMLGRCQESAGEGPCVDAVAAGVPMVLADGDGWGRWSRYGPAAVAAGFGSVAALPLTAHGEPLGVFDVYREESGGFAAEDLAAARTLAEVAAAYLVHARDRQESRAAADEARAAAERLRRRERFHREVLDSMAAATAVVDRDGIVGTVNTAWRQLTGAGVGVGGDGSGPVDEGRYFADVARRLHPAGPALQVEAGVRDVLRGAAAAFQLDLPDRRVEERWYALQVTPLSADGGGAVATYTDITASKQVQAQLFHQATHDPLTGLANRALLHDRLSRAVDSVRRAGALAVLFVDLDGFKLVNDSYGHHTGDQLLRAVAGRLRDAVRPEDTVARFAGDEFVVLCEGLPAERSAVGLAERVLRALTPPVRLGFGELTVTASVGVAVRDAADPGTAEMDADRLLQAADTAMFEAKTRGRGRYACTPRRCAAGPGTGSP